VSFELTSTPPGFAGNPGPQNSNVFNDAVVGNYVITATDACGNSDSFPYEFREDQLQKQDHLVVQDFFLTYHRESTIYNTIILLVVL